MSATDMQTQDPTEGYQAQGYPFYLKLLFLVLIIWGGAFISYFLLMGYDSEADFDQASKAAVTAQPAQTEVPATRGAQPPQGDQTAAVADEEKVASDVGATLFASRCRACHGETGKGGVGPDLTRAQYTFGRDPETVIETITKGRPGGMPAFASTLDADEIRALADYILALP